MTSESAVSLEYLGFKDFWNSKIERVMRKCRERVGREKYLRILMWKRGTKKQRITNEKIIDILSTSL